MDAKTGGMMYTCGICKKEYKYEKAYQKHMEEHDASGGAIAAESISQLLQALQMMNQRLDTIEEKLNPQTPEEIRKELPQIRQEKLEKIMSEPRVEIVGGTNDYGEPESVSMCGHRWTLGIGKVNSVPESIAAIVMSKRERRESRDEVALYYANRMEEGPKELDQVELETRHIRNE